MTKPATPPALDFTAHRHPTLAVSCPTCQARAGTWCKRPSGHQAQDLHKARGAAADAAFIERHGADAWIERLLQPRAWRVHPTGRSARLAAAE